jgi:hypothetical protein
MAVGEAHPETPEDVRAQIAAEREQLAAALESMREATDVSAKLRPKLPLLAVAAFATAFVLGGGVGATARLIARRSREGRERARLGRFTLIDRG